jgi:hypothetical protein
MLNGKRIFLFTFISIPLLFLFIMPIVATANDTCTLTSDKTQSCVVTSPSSGSGGSANPGSPGTGILYPGLKFIEPTPVIPMEKTIPDAGTPIEAKPANLAPDAVSSILTPNPDDSLPVYAVDSISKEEVIASVAKAQRNISTLLATNFADSTIGWVAGLTIIATFVGGVVYALRQRKHIK